MLYVLKLQRRKVITTIVEIDAIKDQLDADRVRQRINSDKVKTELDNL